MAATYVAICIHSWFRKPGHRCNSSLSLSLLSQVPPFFSSSKYITILPALITVLCAGAMLAPSTANIFLSAQARGQAQTLQHVEKNKNNLSRFRPLTKSSTDNWTTVCAWGGSSSRQNGKNPVRHSWNLLENTYTQFALICHLASSIHRPGYGWHCIVQHAAHGCLRNSLSFFLLLSNNKRIATNTARNDKLKLARQDCRRRNYAETAIKEQRGKKTEQATFCCFLLLFVFVHCLLLPCNSFSLQCLAQATQAGCPRRHLPSRRVDSSRTRFGVMPNHASAEKYGMKSAYTDDFQNTWAQVSLHKGYRLDDGTRESFETSRVATTFPPPLLLPHGFLACI